MARIVASLCVVTFALASPAMAQEAGDMQTPEELIASAQQLVVDWPASGDSVQVPFTVTGRAAPGARLELRLGESLERVFRVDANGRFTAPVTRAAPGMPLIVRELDGQGTVLQAVQVDVRWGAAPAAPAEVVVDESIDVFGSAPAAPDAALPRVSELGEDVPPPHEVFAEAPVAPEPAEPAVVQSSGMRSKPPLPLGVRVASESALGLAGAFVGGVGGVLLGVALAPAGDGWAALGYGLLGGVVGWSVGLPIGVILGGKLARGTGKWYGAVLGEAVGLLFGGLLASATAGGDGAVPGLLLIAMPLAGSVTGYELTSTPPAESARALRPIIAPAGNGGVTFGFGLRY